MTKMLSAKSDGRPTANVVFQRPHQVAFDCRVSHNQTIRLHAACPPYQPSPTGPSCPMLIQLQQLLLLTACFCQSSRNVPDLSCINSLASSNNRTQEATSTPFPYLQASWQLLQAKYRSTETYADPLAHHPEHKRCTVCKITFASKLLQSFFKWPPTLTQPGHPFVSIAMVLTLDVPKLLRKEQCFNESMGSSD